MNCILFEDDQVTRLYPITLGRPAYAVTCGGYRLADLARMLFARVRGIVRPHLVQIQAQNEPDLHATELVRDDFTLMLNARVVPSAANLERLGFSEADLADGGSDALINDLVAQGSPENAAAALHTHLDAGADHVVAQPLPGECGLLGTLARLAPALIV
jgi:hypothetical protein